MYKTPTDEQLKEMNKFQEHMELRDFIIIEKKYAKDIDEEIIVSPRFVMRTYLQSKGSKNAK